MGLPMKIMIFSIFTVLIQSERLTILSLYSVYAYLLISKPYSSFENWVSVYLIFRENAQLFNRTPLHTVHITGRYF